MVSAAKETVAPTLHENSGETAWKPKWESKKEEEDTLHGL